MTDLPQVPITDGWRFRDVQLEVSLKPFFDNSPETREVVCREIFEQWRALWRHAETVSVMLWVAEGSEILEYDGNPETEFEWAKYHGAPNRHRWELPGKARVNDPDHASIGINVAEYDPEGVGIHSRAYLYRPEPAVFTYGWLRGLVADLKRIGGEMTGRPVLVGETFDIGPEFAKSRFKFDWHREILSGGPVFKEQFISCEAVLKGDGRRYAAFPDGIPDGTGFGTFFGRQLNRLFEDCGFDFIWFSNGFGFSLEPWAMVGEVFDGALYHPERAAGIRGRILRFWRDLRAEFPLKYRIRTRGTNLATGIDLGSDASPLREIYQGGFGVDAPVNSPWAALDGDFGLELSGWMSHVARHPGGTFRYRFYTHDPWWLNSPWLDRYERQPHDIFLPLSVSRLTRDGTVEIPRDIAFLSVDDSNGKMPLTVPNEVIAHVLRARELAPDAPGPLLWVYPFDDFHELAGHRPDLPLHADAFIGTVINDGVPLNTVVDAAELRAAWRPGPLLVSPVPQAGSGVEGDLLELWKSGADMLFYGALPGDSAIASLLGIGHAEAIDGDFVLTENGRELPRKLRHTGFLSGGGFSEIKAADFGKKSESLMDARCGEVPRVAAAISRRVNGRGRIAWIRASLTTAEYDPADPVPIKGPILKPLDAARFHPPGSVFRRVLGAFGWRIDSTAPGREKRPPYVTIHRHRNAMVLSGHHRDEGATLHLRHPLGAPLLSGCRNFVRDGATEITGRIAWQNEVRVLMESGADGAVRVRELQPVMHGVHRRLLVSGVSGATLHFLVETGHCGRIRILRDPHFPYFAGDFVQPVIVETTHGSVITVANVTGEILFEW
jgi:hypothetical protein